LSKTQEADQRLHKILLSNICLALFWWAIYGRSIRQLWPNNVRPEEQPDRNTADFFS
jgi:hypothetical protein